MPLNDASKKIIASKIYLKLHNVENMDWEYADEDLAELDSWNSDEILHKISRQLFASNIPTNTDKSVHSISIFIEKWDYCFNITIFRIWNG